MASMVLFVLESFGTNMLLSPAVTAPFFFHPKVEQCQRVWCLSHGHSLFASPLWPCPLIRLQHGGNNICAYEGGTSCAHGFVIRDEQKEEVVRERDG